MGSHAVAFIKILAGQKAGRQHPVFYTFFCGSTHGFGSWYAYRIYTIFSKENTKKQLFARWCVRNKKKAAREGRLFMFMEVQTFSAYVLPAASLPAFFLVKSYTMGVAMNTEE
jgi:hypothetical protein